MKFTAIKENLIEGLQIVQRALSSKNTIPILNGIYLACHNGRLEMVATDLDIRIRCSVPVEVIEEGATVVAGKAFTDFVRRLPDVNILFESHSHNGQDMMVVTYGKAKTEMHGWSAHEFPTIPEVKNEVDCTMPSASYNAVIRQTSFTINNDEIRPVFTGILFDIVGHDVTVVGTDSFRLALMREKLNNVSGNSHHEIIPARALSEIARIAGDDTDVVMRFQDGHVFFDVGDVRLMASLIKGEYPPYERVIPDGYETFFKIKRKDLLDSLERATLFSQEKDGTSVVRLQVDGGHLMIHTASEYGQVDEDLTIYQEGVSVDISFNARFLTDALKNIRYDDLDVTMSGSMGPCVFRPMNDERYLYLLLPLRR